MYAAFNTLQLELERLIILLDSMESSGQAANESVKIEELKRKIYSHEKAIKLINREHQAEHRLTDKQMIAAQH
jgi:hypothetical protein